MAFARDSKKTVTCIENGNIVGCTVTPPVDEIPSLPSAQRLVDLEAKVHDIHKAQEQLRAMGAMTAREREAAALRAMNNDPPSSSIASKHRPVAASSSTALSEDQKKLEAKQLAAFSEDPACHTSQKHAGMTRALTDEENNLYKGLKFNSHDPHAPNEVIPVSFPDGTPQEILSFWNSEMTGLDKQSHAVRKQLRFFGKPTQESVLIPLAKKVATLILGGEKKEIEEAITIVKKYPELLRCPPVIARDRSGSPGLRLMTNETDAELHAGAKHLYIGRAQDDGLDYKILSAQGAVIEGHITPKELGQEIKEIPILTLPMLNELTGTILVITSKRGHTPLGRAVKGTLLQIAAMAGDVNLQKEEIKEEKERGVVERLPAIEGGLSQEEVAAQFEQVITGENAKQQNQKKIDRIMTAIKQFGEDILSKEKEYKENINDYKNFPEFQKLCQPQIDELEKALKHDPKEITTSGYVFDPRILYEAANWFEFGYELCLMPNKPDKDIKLEKRKLYLREKDGCITYSVITPDGKEARNIKIDTLKAPKPFELDELNKYELKEKIFQAASQTKHIITNLDRFGGCWSIVSSVFGINGWGKLQKKLSARDGHIASHGIGSLVDDHQIPPRSSNRADNTSDLNSSSGLGDSFCLGYYGASGRQVRAACVALLARGSRRAGWKTCVDQKQQRCKTYAARPAIASELVPDNVTLRF